MSHIIGWSPDPILSNVLVYRDIATESLAASLALEAEGTRPKEGGDGLIKTFDPNHRSFKHSLVAIVFAGMFMEASLWVVGCRRLGIAEYRPKDRWKLEERARAVGIMDGELLASLKTYRESRAELVHEKAVPLPQDTSPFRTGQQEAKKAVYLMLRLESALKALLA